MDADNLCLDWHVHNGSEMTMIFSRSQEWNGNENYTCIFLRWYSWLSTIKRRTSSILMVLVLNQRIKVVSPCGLITHMVGMLPFSSDKTNWACPFLFILFSCLFLSLWLFLLFHFINSADKSPFSHSVLTVLSLPYWSFQLHIPSRNSPSALI